MRASRGDWSPLEDRTRARALGGRTQLGQGDASGMSSSTAIRCQSRIGFESAKIQHTLPDRIPSKSVDEPAWRKSRFDGLNPRFQINQRVFGFPDRNMGMLARLAQ